MLWVTFANVLKIYFLMLRHPPRTISCQLKKSLKTLDSSYPIWYTRYVTKWVTNQRLLKGDRHGTDASFSRNPTDSSILRSASIASLSCSPTGRVGTERANSYPT